MFDIYREILTWLEYADQVAFAMVNQFVCSHLIKRMRRLWWSNKDAFERKFRSYVTSEKLQSFIADPYHQLNLFLPGDLNLKAVGFDGINISCKTLSSTVDQLTTSLIHCIRKVQNLKLHFHDSLTRATLTNSEFQFIVDWINNLNLGLKELTIDNYDFANLPVIPSLESLRIARANIFTLDALNISAYCNLRCLKLTSIKIKDVSSLDGIHDLYLENCREIRDISCLNHNYKIVVEECHGITDYSNSFRYSNIITICCPDSKMREPMKSCDLSKTLEAREISFFGIGRNKPFVLPQSSSLRFVRVETLKGCFTLPSKHKIRQIIVRDCPDFVSLLHFDRIYSVQLVGLRISSLEGLGSANRVVEVNNCPLITDFSVLKHCDKVTILNCQGFKDVNQVRGVKDFIFSPSSDYNFVKDIEGVTCLILNNPFNNLLSLKIPSTLKKLEINSQISDLNRQLPLFLTSLPHHVEKIEITEDEDIIRHLLEKGERSFQDFIVEVKLSAVILRASPM